MAELTFDGETITFNGEAVTYAEGVFMGDNRFPGAGVDARFPAPATDERFPEPGVDAEFLDGVNTRFQGTIYGGGAPAGITADTSPQLAAADDTDTPADVFTTGEYSSGAGTISNVATAYLVNGSEEASSYDLEAGDTLQVSQLVTDSAGNTKTFSTGVVTISLSVALSNTGLPEIFGSASVGQTLSVSQGTWAGSAERTYSYQWTRDGADISGATSNTYTLVEADDATDIGCDVTADDGFTTVTASSETVTVSAPVAFWTGSNFLQSQEDYPLPSTSRLAFTQFMWPETESYEQFVVCQNDGGFRISVRTDGQLRVEQSTASSQILHQAQIGAAPGDRVSVLTQLKNDGVARPYLVVQINDNAPTLLAAKTATSGVAFRVGANFYFGRNLFSGASQYYKGYVYRAAVYHDCPVFDAYDVSKMRDFVDASGAVVDPATSNAVYGTPLYEVPTAPADLNAGTNFGSGADFNVTGTFALGIASDWFDITAQDFDSSTASGAEVATIETNADPAPAYSLQSDPDGLFEITGTSLKRSATAVTYDGEFRPITIRETQSDGTVRDRTFNMFPGQAGEDTLLGRASIVPSRTSCFKDEHIHFKVDGLYDYEQALLYIEFDFGDDTEVYVNTRPDHIRGTSARIKRGHEVLHTFTGTTGVRTATVNIYRMGSATPVWTDSVDVTVADPSTISNVHVVARDGVFTGAPAGTQHATIPAALSAAWAQIQAGEDAIVYLKRGEQWLADDQNSSFQGSGAGAASLLMRPWGTGANPIVQFGNFQNGLKFQNISNPGFSFSHVDIDTRSKFDAFNILTPDNEQTWEKLSYLTFTAVEGHISLTRGLIKGRLLVTITAVPEGADTSASVSDIDGTETEPYTYYFDTAIRSGVDGGTMVKDGGQPNVSKPQLEIEQPQTGTGSVNGPGRIVYASSAILQNQKAAGFHGWSDGFTAAQLQSKYDPMKLPAQQPVSRMASAEFLGDRTAVIVDGEYEGGLQLTSATPSYGMALVARCYFVGHAGTTIMLGLQHRGAWVVSNVFTVANVLGEQGNAKCFVQVDSPVSSLSFASEARHRRQRIIGNTFIDLRSADKLQPGETGTVEQMFQGIQESYVECRNNILYVPNRTISDPGIPGLTVISGEALTTTEIMETNYPGLIAPAPGEFNYTSMSALTVDTDYATPAGTGVEGKLPTGSAHAVAWSGTGPAFDFSGAVVTASRAPGAWKDVSA